MGVQKERPGGPVTPWRSYGSEACRRQAAPAGAGLTLYVVDLAFEHRVQRRASVGEEGAELASALIKVLMFKQR